MIHDLHEKTNALHFKYLGLCNNNMYKYIVCMLTNRDGHDFDFKAHSKSKSFYGIIL